MGCHSPNRIGWVVGDYKIIERLPNHRRKGSGHSLAKYKVECLHCGLQKDSTWHNMRGRHKTANPGCICTRSARASIRNEDKLFKGTKDISGTYIGQVRRSAEGRDMTLNVTKEYLQSLLEEQGFKCVYTGACLKKDSGNLKSLDRIDSSIGYDEGNLQWVTWEVNRMKGALSESQFLQLTETITQHRI